MPRPAHSHHAGTRRIGPRRAEPQPLGLRVAALLRTEAIGGGLLVGAALIALIWANSPWASGYAALRDLEVGFAPWHLRLTLGAWASDGLLAIFFFLVGLELKREFVSGDLRHPGRALVPVAAAIGGVVVPALVYLAITAASGEDQRGWAIPTATDIAFAVAVLAIVGSHLPPALRLFLLTLAVVDDLLAIVIIATVYTSSVEALPVLAAGVVLALFAFLAHRYRRLWESSRAAGWLVLVPLGVIVWALVHASGIHATIAGVALALCVPVAPSRLEGRSQPGPGLAETLEHRVRPLSAGLAVPLFAFFAAGVTVGGINGLTAALGDPVLLGIALALVIGKPVGILLTTWIITRTTPARLDPSLAWADVAGIGLLGGIGFTVSLLIAELSFETGSTSADNSTIAILLASAVAATLGGSVLGLRNLRYRRRVGSSG